MSSDVFLSLSLSPSLSLSLCGFLSLVGGGEHLRVKHVEGGPLTGMSGPPPSGPFLGLHGVRLLPPLQVTNESVDAKESIGSLSSPYVFTNAPKPMQHS